MTHPIFDRRRLFGAGLAAAGLEMIAQAAVASPSASDSVPAARAIDPPSSISQGAQQYLRKGAAAPPPTPVPATADVRAWQAYVEQGNTAMPLDLIAKISGFTEEKRVVGDATYYVVTPNKLGEADRKNAHVFIHGGDWILFGGAYAAAFAKIMAMQFNCVTYAVDYRMPPDHPFPAGLEDCVSVYQEVIKAHGAKNVFVSGASAGGNLAAALMLKLKDLGLAAPCALYVDSPVTDLTNSGDSWRVLDGLDPVLRDAGVAADLYISEAMPHAGFGGITVEDAAVLADTRRWLKAYWPST